MFSLLMRQTLSGSRVSLWSFLAVSTKLSRVEDNWIQPNAKLRTSQPASGSSTSGLNPWWNNFKLRRYVFY